MLMKSMKGVRGRQWDVSVRVCYWGGEGERARERERGRTRGSKTGRGPGKQGAEGGAAHDPDGVRSMTFKKSLEAWYAFKRSEATGQR